MVMRSGSRLSDGVGRSWFARVRSVVCGVEIEVVTVVNVAIVTAEIAIQ